MSGPHDRLYDLRRWRRRSALQLKHHPMCQKCEAEGRVTAATLSHHVEEHHGDLFKFHYGKLESLCHDCHLIAHGRAPKRDNDTTIGVDGWPISKQHPTYRPVGAKREAQR
jgi:hypothetical protein